jgi:hypothetical protein
MTVQEFKSTIPIQWRFRYAPEDGPLGLKHVWLQKEDKYIIVLDSILYMYT